MKRILCVLMLLSLLFTASGCGTAKGNTDYLILVNGENKLPDGWEARIETVNYTNSLGENLKIEKKTYDSYKGLKAALAGENVYIDIGTALVSAAAQQKVFDETAEKYGKEYAEKYVADFGYSEHNTALAVDLYLNIHEKDVYEKADLSAYPEIWEKVHTALAGYGFILRYPSGKQSVTGMEYEPWHIRFVGSAEVARKIAESGVTLEEYLNKPLSPKSENSSSGFNGGDNSAVVLIGVSGNGHIAYAKEGGELEYGDKFVTQSARFILTDTNKYIIGARPLAGSKFVKWTKNGDDFSTKDEILVEINGDTEFTAVFAEE